MYQTFLIALIGLFALSFHVSEEANAKNSNMHNSELHDIWALESLQGVKLMAADYPRGVPTLEISVSESRVNGFGGCNQYFGAFTVNDHAISIENIGATKMYCAGVPEQAYFAMLGNANSYQRDGLLLILFAGETEIARFKKVD